jgi:large subunit ribosomal protein L7/L12
LSGVSKAIGDARQAQKEFRFEGTERQRQKANDKLRAAREAFEAGDTATGDAGLAEALQSFTEMKATYDLTHK